MRKSDIARKTSETDISLSLCLDGQGRGEINTGVGFLDHMLTLFALHGGFDHAVSCKGDTDVDGHHSAEDIGICLGTAFAEALGDKVGIARYGSIILPMDEALVMAAADVSGRGMLCCSVDFPTEKIGDFDTQLVEEFFAAFARSGGVTLHLRKLDGRNSHHIAEAVFKGAARALGAAAAVTGGGLPSTKGVL